MRKAIIGLTVVLGLALIALASVAIAVSAASAQDGRVDTPCAGYTVDVQQDADGYDMLLTYPCRRKDSRASTWKWTGNRSLTQRATATTCFAYRSPSLISEMSTITTAARGHAAQAG